MRSYIISVIGAAVLGAFSGIICPQKWTKYIRLFTGIAVALIITAPLGELMKTDISAGLSFSATDIDRYYMQKQLINEFEKRICADAEAQIAEKTGTAARVSARAAYDGDYKINGISYITIHAPQKALGSISTYLAARYGIDKTQVRFDE